MVQCGVVHFYLQCGKIIPFCKWLWCGFCGLANTPTISNYVLLYLINFAIQCIILNVS